MGQSLKSTSKEEILKMEKIVEMNKEYPRMADEKLVQWFMEVLDCMAHEPFLDKVPIALEEFRKADFGRKEKLKNSPAFWKRPDIDGYLNRKSANDTKNSSNRFWLEWTLKNLDQPEVVSRRRIEGMIREFPEVHIHRPKEQRPQTVMSEVNRIASGDGAGWDD